MRKLVSIGFAAFVMVCTLGAGAAATTSPDHPVLACKGLGAKCQLSTECCSGNCNTNWRCVR
jgi:hypothetical protein